MSKIRFVRSRLGKAAAEKDGRAPGTLSAQHRQPSAAENILALQTSIGNSAFAGILESRDASLQRAADRDKSSRSQTPVRLSNPDDPSEREADRVATAATGQVPKVESAANSNPSLSGSPLLEDVSAVLARDGKPLPSHLRDFFEPSLGRNLGQVRLHTNEGAARAAKAINARAYTVGDDIAFGAGEYAPETARGRGLLAHELAHASQVKQSGPPTIHRKTKGEEMVDKSNVFLSQDTNLKAEVDVLKAAIREIKKGKSAPFNKKAGLTRVANAAAILKLDATKTAALTKDWEWLADNAKKAGKTYATKEKAFFAELHSPINVIAEKYPEQQTKYWLKNTAPQIADIIIKVADADITAEQLFAYANKEGLVDEYTRPEIGLGASADPTSAQLAGVSTTKTISGFQALGLDDFMTEVGDKKDPLTGYLPSGFDLKKTTPRDRVNEFGTTVHSADFPNLTMAIQALFAMLKRRRKHFLTDATAQGYATPTTDELVYWTYLYFNSGENTGQLAKYKGKRKLSDWIKKGEYPNAIKVLQSYQMLKDMKLF